MKSIPGRIASTWPVDSLIGMLQLAGSTEQFQAPILKILMLWITRPCDLTKARDGLWIDRQLMIVLLRYSRNLRQRQSVTQLG
jgi:hypothetical protein